MMRESACTRDTAKSCEDLILPQKTQEKCWCKSWCIQRLKESLNKQLFTGSTCLILASEMITTSVRS